mgnify:FL=1
MKSNTNIITFAGILILSLLVTYVNADTQPEIPDSSIFNHVQNIRVLETGDDAHIESVTGANESRIMHAYYRMTVNITGDATYTYTGLIKRDRGVPVIINTDLDSKGMNLQMENALYLYALQKWNATGVKISGWKPYSKP